MKKWFVLLALALLFHAGWARAEETYYTNNEDVYYHSDPDCDRPSEQGRYGLEGMFFYARECFQKYEISEEAAIAFERKACPVCVKGFEPVYLGEHTMDWNYDFSPWDLGDRVRGWDDEPLGSKEYQAETSDTYDRFQAYFEEVYDREADTYARKHPYPDSFAGMWANNADGMSYAFVDPTQELLDAFQKNFGGGAWIVPAKYGYNEMYALQEEIFDWIEAWQTEHPDLDIHVNMASVDQRYNYLGVGLYGEDWDAAMPVLDAEMRLPIWVYFFHSSELSWDAEF